ncbi:kinase-like protein [Hesseltinella vesiculosa]|uniref:Kinase-like protein n=1 Tax=Hesseltinella vesiculosa TaxID=101127 RepID=A0A1X2GR42_9FUNG|nr:kinase-like protein [Hesseltinella vesiculosa]
MSVVLSDAASIAPSSWSDETMVDRLPVCRQWSRSSRFLVVKGFCRRKSETHRQYVKRVSGEYCILSVLSHTNIAHAEDLLMENYQFYIVMGLNDPGTPLTKWIKSTLDPVGDYAQLPMDILKQVGLAVEYLHGLGVAHLDIHPDNILIVDRKLKLTNFSSAMVFQAPLQQTQQRCSRLLGHAHGSFIAPEALPFWQRPSSRYHDTPPQAQTPITEHPAYYDARALDVWAMGIFALFLWQQPHTTLWDLASKRDHEFSLFTAHYANQSYPGFASIPRSLHKSLLYPMLCPDPQHRITIEQLMMQFPPN